MILRYGREFYVHDHYPHEADELEYARAEALPRVHARGERLAAGDDRSAWKTDREIQWTCTRYCHAFVEAERKAPA